MKTEKQIQETMLYDFTQNRPRSSNQAIYQKLIFYRFEETLKNLASRFCSLASEPELENSLQLFIAHSSPPALVWQIIDLYRKFIKKQKLFHHKKYIYDVLLLECLQLDILMQEKPPLRTQSFAWQNTYKLAKWAKVARLSYSITSKDVERKEQNFLLVYYDFITHNVFCRSIDDFFYFLLKRLDKSLSLEQCIYWLCDENDIQSEQVFQALQEPLQQLIIDRVIVC